MSESDESDSPPADLPRLRIYHLLALTTIFSVVMSVNMGYWRLLRTLQPSLEMPEISGGISVLMIVQFLAISVCIAVVVFGFAWQRRGIVFPSQPGHWVAVYWTLTWFHDWVSHLAMFIPRLGIVYDSIRLVLVLMSLAFYCLVAYLWIVAYWRESSRIWKWGWAAMALTSALSVCWLLFVVAIKFIEWVVEVVWYVDWQLFQPFGTIPTSFLQLKMWLRLYILLAFFIVAMISDLRNNRQRHWSHWAVLISTSVSTALLIVYYHLAL